MSQPNVLKAFLQERGLRQMEMAATMQYSHEYISQVANGHAPLSLPFVGRVLKYYGADAAEIFLPYVDTYLTRSDAVSAD